MVALGSVHARRAFVYGTVALHFVRGNEYQYGATIAWAVTVDIAAGSTWFWIVSGIYLWVRRPRNRTWGGICLLGGGLLFVLLAILVCR